MSDDAIQKLIFECRELEYFQTGSGRARVDQAQGRHTANRDTIAALKSSLEGRAAEVAQLQAERSAVVQTMSLTLDHATARAEKAEAKVARVQALLEREGCSCDAHPDELEDEDLCFGHLVERALEGGTYWLAWLAKHEAEVAR